LREYPLLPNQIMHNAQNRQIDRGSSLPLPLAE
jgi:hypothetical protein